MATKEGNLRQKLLPKNLKLGTVIITRRNFGEFLKSLKSPLPALMEENNRSAIEPKEMFKNVMNIKNVSLATLLEETKQEKVRHAFKPFLEVETILRKLRNYVYSKTVPIDTKKARVLKVWDNLIAIFEKHDMKKYKLYVMQVKGNICFAFQFLDQALFEYRKAKRYAKEQDFFVEQAELYKAIARWYHYFRRYSDALVYYKKQLQLAWDLGLKAQELDAYDNIGVEYFLMGDMDKAMKYHTRSMNNVLEAQTSPAKRASAISLFRKQMSCETPGEQYGNLLKQEDTEAIRQSLHEKAKKQITCVTLEEMLRRKSKWEAHDLPSASMSQRPVLMSCSSLPAINAKPKKGGKGGIQIPLYSHLGRIKDLEGDNKMHGFDKVLRETKKLREKLYDDFFKI